MDVTLRELAELVGGELAGDGDLRILGAATIRDARPGEITLADKPKLAGQLAASQATAVVVPLNFSPEGLPHIRVRDVHKSFARIVARFHPPRTNSFHGIHPQSSVAESARVGEGTTIHAGATIGDDVEIGARCVIHAGVRIMAGCRVGDDVTMFPNAVLYEGTLVGHRCIIHGGAVIGAYGFGYETVEGRHRLSAQLGYVELEADVEVGACTTIDRGTYGPTLIGEGSKLDNQVMIAHNCRIGRHNIICSQVGIAGSCTTGDYVVLAGQVGIRDHIHIGERAVIGAQSGIMCDVPAGLHCLGSPALPERDEMRVLAARARLPELRKQIKALQRAVEELGGHPLEHSDRDAA